MTRNDYPQTETAGRIVAHRGASRVAPENTLSAFRAAAGQGARWIEFDVSLLGDGTPVVHHNATLDRCTDHTGPLGRLGAADLAGIDAGRWFGPAYAGEPLATLEQTLDLIEELGLSANLEMKPHGAPPDAIAAAVGRSLARRWWCAARVVVSSFDLDALAALRQDMPAQPLAVLYEAPPEDWPQVLHELGAEALHIWYEHITPDLIARVGEEGFRLRVYTVNDPDRIADIRQGALTGVFTDHPPLFLEDPAWATWAAR